MRKYEACDSTSIHAVLDHLNACHDGVIRRISFVKDRSYDTQGNVSWPSVVAEGEEIGSLLCNVEMEILLNSYVGASLKQVVLLYFEGVRVFRFSQETRDYSEILEVVFREAGEHAFAFVFRAGPERRPIDVLALVCQKMLCVELENLGDTEADDKN